ncbi:DUF1972 domain-containing protein [Rhodococcus sp. 1163]|uniref:DUF1972 domain-containing protein n=1 Tax=Rhodococcus sp. 1163 TaxID=1905289 RepID=UPI000A04F5B8|nr:DUF1972 domain-containing protein [Rhodococcus sp. 1163]
MRGSVAIIGTRGYPSYYGGFETLVRRLAPYLSDAGWDVTVYGRGGEENIDDPERDPTVESVVTWGLESKSLSTLSFGLSATLDTVRRRHDVALVMNVANGFWLPLLKARGIPSCVNVDGIEWERAKWGRGAKAAFRMGASLTAKYADHLIYDAQGIADRWQESFGKSGTVISYGGEDPGALGVPDGLISRGYILMVARFVPENTITEFLDAATSLARDHDVVIVGSSGYGGELDERVAALDAGSERIHWYGHVSNDALLFALWQHAGAYFHGHSVGGTNPALVQAMACGAPIVARDTVFNREVLGSCAVFVEPTVVSIIRGISLLMSDSEMQSKLSSAARSRAAESYTWDSVCAGYLGLLESSSVKSRS